MKKDNLNRKLDQINREGEFKFPEGYFEKMHSEIETKINLEDASKNDVSTKTISLRKGIPKSFYYIAAAACLILGIVLYNSGVAEECQTFACLLENTEITSSDIEFLEQDETTDFLDDDYDDDYLNL